jgi:hypothetical protein
MTNKNNKPLFIAFLSAAFFVLIVMAGSNFAQVPRPTDPRMEDIKKLQENNNIQAEQQRDSAKMRSKEERMGIVNESFRRLQMLHNEMMTLLSSGGTVEPTKILEIGNEVKLRSSELNANLALPELPKEKKKENASAEPQPAEPVPISAHMTRICAQIRDFVKSVNASPTDPKAGIQARRDLIEIIEMSDQMILSIGPVK